MSDSLAAAVGRAFPGRTVAELDEQTTRKGNETARVRFEDGGSAYVKTATDTNVRLAREVAATRYACANCSIEVPEVIAADVGASPPYLATEPLPGHALNDPWTDGAEREPLLRAAGRTLAAVHELGFDRPGRIVGGDDESLDLAGESWTEVLCETVEWRAEDWFADRFADIPGRLVDFLREMRPVLDEVTPALLHGDCSRINVHLEPRGLLDWERAMVGDPAFDVVDAVGHLVDQVDVDEDEREPLTQAFYDGYRDRAGALPEGLDRRRPVYWPVAHLLVPQTFEEWAPDVDTPNDELAEGIREEFDARLSAARDAIE